MPWRHPHTGRPEPKSHAATLEALEAETRKSTDADAPPLSTFPGRKAERRRVTVWTLVEPPPAPPAIQAVETADEGTIYVLYRPGQPALTAHWPHPLLELEPAAVRLPTLDPWKPRSSVSLPPSYRIPDEQPPNVPLPDGWVRYPEISLYSPNPDKGDRLHWHLDDAHQFELDIKPYTENAVVNPLSSPRNRGDEPASMAGRGDTTEAGA